MLNGLFGWYIYNRLNARSINIIFKETFDADETGTLQLTDAVDGTTLKNNLANMDYIIFDVYAFSNPGLVNFTIIPDADVSHKYVMDAYGKSVRAERLRMPLAIMADLSVDYVNDSQVNDVYLRLSGIQFNDDRLDDFTIISENFMVLLEALSSNQAEIVRVLSNMYSVQIGEEPTYGKPTVTGVGKARCRR